MANQLSLRMDDKLRDEVHAQLKEMGIKPSEAVRSFYEYIKNEKKLPFRHEILSHEDAELLRLARSALENDDDVIEVNLDELKKRLQISV